MDPSSRQHGHHVGWGTTPRPLPAGGTPASAQQVGRVLRGQRSISCTLDLCQPVYFSQLSFIKVAPAEVGHLPVLRGRPSSRVPGRLQDKKNSQGALLGRPRGKGAARQPHLTWHS